MPFTYGDHIELPYIPAYNPPLFLNFWWSKVCGRGLKDEHKTKTFFQNQNFGMSTIHPFDDELDDVAVDQFTLIKLLFSFIFLDLGGAYMTNKP